MSLAKRQQKDLMIILNSKFTKFYFILFNHQIFHLKKIFIQLSSIKDILAKCIVKVKIGFFLHVIMIY